MVKITTGNSLRIITILILSFIFYECANQLPPGGGAIDTTPPEIVKFFPDSGTTNFNKDYIELSFSEYIDKSTFQDAFFISPAVEGIFDYDWSGTSVKVNFPQKLKDSVTYVITIGTEIQDLHNRNKMAQARALTFSTGPTIDKGVIKGKMFDKEPQGVMIFAYILKDSIPNPMKNKPEYLSQTGINGEYSMPGLAYGKYRVYAVKEKYSNLVYDIGEDNVGVPFMDVLLSETDSVVTGLDFFVFGEDTTKPRLSSTIMTDRNHILLEFNEPIDSTIISTDNFSIYDSTANRQLIPQYAFKGRGKLQEMVLSLSDTLNAQNQVYLTVRKIIDKMGNITENEYSSIIVSAKMDTSAPAILGIKSYPIDNTVELEQPEFIFTFDDGFDSSLAKNSIAVIDNKENKLPYRVNFIDDASFIIKIMQTLKPNSQYAIHVNLNNLFDAAGNKRDSVHKHQVKTSGGLDFSGVSGIVSGLKDDSQNTRVILRSTDKGKIVYSEPVNKNREFNFKKVNPGKYLLWSYIDSDSSKTYSRGNPFPFKEAEKFTFYPDTLNLRARWPVGDVKVEYKK